MRVLAIVLVVILAFFALHAAAYGVGFLASADDALSEFGYDVAETSDDEADDSARIMVRLIGVGMLSMAAVAVAAGWMIVRRVRSGLWLTAALGTARLATGIVMAFGDGQLRSDGLAFGATGLLITVIAGVLWVPGWSRPQTPTG